MLPRSAVRPWYRMIGSSTSTSAAAGPSTPVRLVLFDVFDTLCTPRLPVHEQYHAEAVSAGIPSSSISPSSVRAAFKPAFRESEARYPLYGKHSTPPLTPGAWWTQLIERCMQHAGADAVDIERAMPKLGPSLLQRFESDVGYRNFPETIKCLQRLRDLNVQVSVVSNADPRILRTLDGLHITPLLTSPPTLSWDVEASKPDPRIFRAACQSCGVEPGTGVIMVGDELEADFRGAQAAGLEARLIRRQGEWSDGARRTKEEDLKGVQVISSLEEVVAEVQRRNEQIL